MNRALARTQLLADGGPPRCPECGHRLAFGTDREGRTLEQCDCGYRAYLLLRDGKRGATDLEASHRLGGDAPCGADDPHAAVR